MSANFCAGPLTPHLTEIYHTNINIQTPSDYEFILCT